MDCARKIALYHNWPQHRTKLKQIDRFGDANSVNTSNFIATTLRFSGKFEGQFSHLFIFHNMFHESHVFVAMPVTSCVNDTCY